MNAKLWREIVEHKDSEIFTANNYNESYSIDINLTIKEIREIEEILIDIEKIKLLLTDDNKN